MPKKEKGAIKLPFINFTNHHKELIIKVPSGPFRRKFTFSPRVFFSFSQTYNIVSVFGIDQKKDYETQNKIREMT